MTPSVENRVLPTVADWSPKRSDINDPYALERIEEQAIVLTKQKVTL